VEFFGSHIGGLVTYSADSFISTIRNIHEIYEILIENMMEIREIYAILIKIPRGIDEI
jgi:hypothetical protein